MKTLVLSMISIAATIAAMTACTSEGDPIDNIDNGQPVEIKASAGIGQIITKTAGVITDGKDVENIEFVIVEKESVPSDWSTEALKATDATINTDGFKFSTPQYYNPISTIKSHLIGYHPKTEGGGSRSNNVVTYTTITGQEDIMCTGIVSGNKEDNKTKALDFTFDHQLAQYTFKIQAEDQQAVATWGKISSIKLIGQQTTATLTLDTKTGEFTGVSTGEITVGDEAKAFDATDPVNNAVTYGSPIMVKPDQTNMKVKIVTEKNPGIEIPLTVASVKSTSYIVTLTFKATEIGATAKIGEWKTGVGTGDVQ